MTDVSNKKVRITVNAVYNTGVPLFEDREFIADSRVLQTPSASFRCVELRMMVPAREAEEFSNALRRGEVELVIQDIPPRMLS
jgi:hypothetical protein